MGDYKKTLDTARLDRYVEAIQEQNAATDRLDGWFLAREIMMENLLSQDEGVSPAMSRALQTRAVVESLPLSIRPGEIFAGTEDDAFARSYALINPDFRVETFEGYCDEDAVYNDISPDGGSITPERIEKVRGFWSDQPFSKMISGVYDKTGDETREVVYFVERVTGHTIPDFRSALHRGLGALIAGLEVRKTGDKEKDDYFDAISVSLRAAIDLSNRYADTASELSKNETDPVRRAELELIADTCRRVPEHPAENLYEAMQSFIILWQVMNLEQLPNPFAFSVGNLDRILQPFFEMDDCGRELAVQLVRHLLAFFCVGDRNWAISQNIMAGGMDENGRDLTCDMSYVILDAFRQSNYSQPNLSVKTHPGTPREFYQAIAEFMFDFGHSTPSFFNDTVVFKALETKGVKPADMPLYAAAGCQEPLVMGKESANTTNSWLNLAKVLELALNKGRSMISGKQIAPLWKEIGFEHDEVKTYEQAKELFYLYLDYFIPRMVDAANGCTSALATLPVPFHSAFMGGLETGTDMRDMENPCTEYNGSGCLIHGLGNVADSFSAIKYLEENGQKFGVGVSDLLEATRKNFRDSEDVRDLVLRRAPGYGNNDPEADAEAVDLQVTVSRKINSCANPAGKPFCADWSTPSTNLLYGYWTGATPDGRLARQPLSYGLDPVVGTGRNGLLPRLASQGKLDYSLMSGGSAVALSINPDPLKDSPVEEKADYLRRVTAAVFGYNEPGSPGLMYAYFNVYSVEKLRDVMEHPEKYSEPVLVRIHGQYGDARHLSPDILSGDILPRLDPLSNSF